MNCDASSSTNSSHLRKTFAEALNNVCDIPLSQLSQPCMKGDALSIKNSEEEYKVGLDGCKNNLYVD